MTSKKAGTCAHRQLANSKIVVRLILAPPRITRHDFLIDLAGRALTMAVLIATMINRDDVFETLLRLKIRLQRKVR